MCARRKHTQTHTYSADRTAVVDLLSTTRSGQTELTGSRSGTGQPCSACNLNTERERHWYASPVIAPESQRGTMIWGPVGGPVGQIESETEPSSRSVHSKTRGRDGWRDGGRE